MNNTLVKLKLSSSVFIFGTIGIFVEFIPLPSGAIAFVRGVVGALCLLIFALLTKTEISFKNIKANLPLLLLSGGAIGFNWILLFEAYRHTTVATATICYYMAPVFVILASPYVLKEKLTFKNIVCIGVALLGMVFVSGAFKDTSGSGDDIIGILFGLAAAVLYASVILLNKKTGEISAHNKTTMQLAVAAIVVLPYVIFAEEVTIQSHTTVGIILLLCVGVIHTGIAYLLYFGAVKELPAQTVAIFGYIDPVVAIILSVLILRQIPDMYEIIGAILILASTFVSEIKLNN